MLFVGFWAGQECAAYGVVLASFRIAYFVRSGLGTLLRKCDMALLV